MKQVKAPRPQKKISTRILTRYVLQLFVVGTTPASSRAVVNIRKLCEAYLPGRYELEVVDLANNPAAASSSQIVAAPTLIKQLPAPIRRFIGDMSNTEKVLVGLDIKARAPSGTVSASE
jgi:circadian clock protein KaiB